MIKSLKMSEVSLYGIALILVAVAVFILNSQPVTENSPFASSELNIASLSPNGMAGGALMPASGCSGTESDCDTGTTGGATASCTVSLSPATPNLGQQVVATVSGTFTTVNGVNRCNSDLSGCVYLSNAEVTNVITTALTSGQDYAVQAVVTNTYDCNCDAEGYCNQICNDSASCASAFQINSALTTGMQICDLGGGGCVGSGGTKTIDPGDQVQVGWTSTGANNCVALEGTGFSTGGAISGIDDTITEPAANNSTNYRVECSNASGESDIRGVIVETNPVSLRADLESNDLTLNSGTLALNESVSFRATVDNTGSASTGAFQDNFSYQWNGTSGAWTEWDSMSHSAFSPSAAVRTDTSVLLPITQSGNLYIQHCVDSNALGAFGSDGDVDESNEGNNCSQIGPLTVTAPPTPSVTMQVCDLGAGSVSDPSCVSGTKTITQGEEVEISWSSTDATSCSFGEFDGDGQNTSGTDTTITEPPPPTSNGTTYTVICENSINGPTSNAQVRVEAQAAALDISVDTNIVRVGEDVEVSWNTGSFTPDQCFVSGGELDINPLGTVASPTVGDQTVTVESQTTFVIDCAGSTDEETVSVLPEIIET